MPKRPSNPFWNPSRPPVYADMRQQRMLYTMALAGGLVFYWAYRQWLAGFLLTLLLLLPWISLLISLPAALLGKLGLQHPQAVTLGSDAQFRWELTGFLPPPSLVGKLRCRSTLWGKQKKVFPGKKLPTSHCGTLELGPGLVWATDYLGLLQFPVGRVPRMRIPVRPLPIKPVREPDLSRFYSGALAPKSGGGYSENHELRLYRPGDNLRQIHWKLSAKTGKLILREPLEIKNALALVSLELAGTPEKLDEKLGKLLWMMEYLTEKGIPHRVCCGTGEGVKTFPIQTEGDILPALDAVLLCPPVEKDATPVYPHALWRYHIGGDDGDA